MPTVSGAVFTTGVEATGRRAFSEIVDDLSRPVDASDSTIRALAADAFRAAVRTMNRKGFWPWEVLDEEVAITTNEPLSTLSSGNSIKKPLAMHYLSASGGVRDQRIGYTDYARFVEKYNMNISGEPHTYTIPNLFETGQVRWFPIPSGSDTAMFTYYRNTPAPRDEAEPVEAPEYALEVYMAFAWYELAKRLPAEQRYFPIQAALSEAYRGFRELSALVASPGDRSREVSGGRYP